MAEKGFAQLKAAAVGGRVGYGLDFSRKRDGVGVGGRDGQKLRWREAGDARSGLLRNGNMRVWDSRCHIASGWGKGGLIGILVSLRNPAELSTAEPIYFCI